MFAIICWLHKLCFGYLFAGSSIFFFVPYVAPCLSTGNPKTAAISCCVMVTSKQSIYLPLHWYGEREQFLSGSQNPNNISDTVLFLPSLHSALKHRRFLTLTQNVVLSSISPLSLTRGGLTETSLSFSVCGQSLIHLRPISGHSPYLAQGSLVITLLTTIMCGVRQPLELPLSGWVSQVKGF